jgi:hypothetical protein
MELSKLNQPVAEFERIEAVNKLADEILSESKQGTAGW